MKRIKKNWNRSFWIEIDGIWGEIKPRRGIVQFLVIFGDFDCWAGERKRDQKAKEFEGWRRGDDAFPRCAYGGPLEHCNGVVFVGLDLDLFPNGWKWFGFWFMFSPRTRPSSGLAEEEGMMDEGYGKRKGEKKNLLVGRTNKVVICLHVECTWTYYRQLV